MTYAGGLWAAFAMDWSTVGGKATDDEFYISVLGMQAQVQSSCYLTGQTALAKILLSAAQCIVTNLGGDDDTGNSLVDENEAIQHPGQAISSASWSQSRGTGSSSTDARWIEWLVLDEDMGWGRGGLDVEACHARSGQAFSRGPSFGTDEEKARMLLVMRVLSIVPLNFKPAPWSAPLSRELLVFNSFVRSLTRALRMLLEVMSQNMLLRNDARRARDNLLDIVLSLSFQTEVNAGFGVLGKVYLDALTHTNNRTRVRDANAPGVREAKARAQLLNTSPPV
ncbi:temperature dependent protein affecting M2 dsRNA replication-domain-containing protein [Mycena filopes]|nr:temperature dependent protein affecting M2 dsRNA replication-domain-containing protein [Mycena filopes]